MAVFKLSSDKHFIRTFKDKPDIYVYEYLDDPNAFDMIRVSHRPHWNYVAKVGPMTPFTELEVQGVTIRSDQLTQLANDLTLTADPAGKQCDPQTFHLIVNRQGLCLLFVDSPSSSIMRLRVNDYFGWSKYGVTVGQAGLVWNRWDMSSGVVLVPAGSGPGSNDCCWKKLLEEKDKALEEKDREVAALKLAMKALLQ